MGPSSKETNAMCPIRFDWACMRQSGVLETSSRIGVRPDSIQVSGGMLSIGLPTCLGVARLPVCGPPDTVARSGSRGDCPARSSAARLADPSVR